MTLNLQTNPPAKVDLSEHIEQTTAGDAYPKGSRISVKHIAYLYAYCRKHPRDIVARYPRTLTDALVHLALAHYYLNRERFDAQIAEDRNFNAQDTLSRRGRLPDAGLGALLEAAELEAKAPVKKSTLAKG